MLISIFNVDLLPYDWSFKYVAKNNTELKIKNN